MPHNPNWLGLFTGTLHQIYHMHLVNQEHHHLHQGLHNCICISSSTKYHYPSHRAQFWFLERKVLLLLYWSLAILLFRSSIMYNQEEGKEEEFKRWRKKDLKILGFVLQPWSNNRRKPLIVTGSPIHKHVNVEQMAIITRDIIIIARVTVIELHSSSLLMTSQLGILLFWWSQW